jgi:mono/diheme cytochrome c family protein/uncharacterized membrane protein
VKFARKYIARIDAMLPESRSTRTLWAAALVFTVLLLLLPVVLKLDGNPHADWQQFLGRFHPLMVHLPVALVLLVPLLEIVGAIRPALREAAGFVLGLAWLGCLGAVALGYLLAYGSGDAGAGVTRHMWGGIALTIGVMLCLLARPFWLNGHSTRVYPAMLCCVLLLLVWAAHEGGSLTHGSNYLTKYMPPPAKRWATLEMVQSKAPDANSFYVKHINPILDTNCVACHGDEKVKGGLRLDSYEEMMKGGKDGAAIVPGKPEESLLLQRVTLPTDHKKFMPAEGKPPLSAEQISWLKAWVQQGASPTAVSVAGISIHEEIEELPRQPVGDYSALMPEILQMQIGQGAKLTAVSSKPSDGLILNTVDASSNFTDADLKRFEKFAPYIVEAELGSTSVTNASFDTLGKFTHLRALHLERTNITGEGLAKLAPLTQLIYLNLSGTKVTQAAVAPLAAMKNLHHLYLYNTPADPVPVASAPQTIARSTP